jgi:hypothetical protein
MPKITQFNHFLENLSHFSPILLTILIIILYIKNDTKSIFYLITILLLSYIFHKYERHHVIPVVAFYLYNTLQVWLYIVLDFISGMFIVL